MFLYSICCGNSQILRSSIGATCSFRSLKHHRKLIYESLFPTRRHQTRSISITVLARTTSRWRKQSFSNSHHGLKCSNSQSLSTLNHFSAAMLRKSFLEPRPNGLQLSLFLILKLLVSHGVMTESLNLLFVILWGGKNSTFQTLINPEKGIRNTHVHGISNRMLSRPEVPRYVLYTSLLYIFCVIISCSHCSSSLQYDRCYHL
jgi:hypothetical protein